MRDLVVTLILALHLLVLPLSASAGDLTTEAPAGGGACCCSAEPAPVIEPEPADCCGEAPITEGADEDELDGPGAPDDCGCHAAPDPHPAPAAPLAGTPPPAPAALLPASGAWLGPRHEPQAAARPVRAPPPRAQAPARLLHGVFRL